jgi:hypothetical protein
MADDIFNALLGFINSIGKPAGKLVDSMVFWVILICAGLAFCIWQMITWKVAWYVLPVGIIAIFIVYKIGIWGWERLQQM